MALKSFDKLLNSGGGNPLETLAQRAGQMERLTEVVRRSVPQLEAAEITAVNLRDDGELVVVCRRQAWAARVRFEGERIIEAATRQGHAVRSCRVRVGRGDA